MGSLEKIFSPTGTSVMMSGQPRRPFLTQAPEPAIDRSSTPVEATRKTEDLARPGITLGHRGEAIHKICLV